MPSRPRLVYLLHAAQRHLQSRMAAEHVCTAVEGQTAPSPAQAGVLFSLAQHDGATMGELAHTLNTLPSALSGLVQRMEMQHWVQRQNCELDARTQRVWLRPAGQAQIPPLKQSLRRLNTDLVHGFSNEEMTIVARWLKHVQQLPIPPKPH